MAQTHAIAEVRTDRLLSGAETVVAVVAMAR